MAPANDPAPRGGKRTRTLVAWGAALALAALFTASGAAKLANADAATGVPYDEQFEAWGLPGWFARAVGLAEVAGAVGLLVPRLRSMAAAGLTAVMVGAVGTHLANAEAAAAPVPAVLGLALVGLVALDAPAWRRAAADPAPAEAAA
jgi:putative oxidoreductase